MSVIEINHESKVLKKYKTLTIIGNIEKENIKKLKVMFFLHGLGSDSKSVLYKTEILEYAKNNNFLIIFVDVDRSYYTNTIDSRNYYDYITIEVYEFIQNTFNVNFKRENMYLMGISMGGYGAFKYMFNESEKFKYVISVSGSLDIVKRDYEKRLEDNYIKKEWEGIFGAKLDKKCDLFHLADKSVQKDMKIIILSGKDDYLYDGNVKFVKKLESLNYDVNFITIEGAHTWDTFRRGIDIVFNEINI